MYAPGFHKISARLREQLFIFKGWGMFFPWVRKCFLYAISLDFLSIWIHKDWGKSKFRICLLSSAWQQYFNHQIENQNCFMKKPYCRKCRINEGLGRRWGNHFFNVVEHFSKTFNNNAYFVKFYWKYLYNYFYL